MSNIINDSLKFADKDYFVSLEKNLNLDQNQFEKEYLIKYCNYKIIKETSRITTAGEAGHRKNIYYKINDKDALLVIIIYKDSEFKYVKSFLEVLLDLEDVDKVSDHCWRFSKFTIRNISSFIWILDTIQCEKVQEKVILSKYILYKNNIIPTHNSKNVILRYKNWNCLDLRKENLFYKNVIQKEDIEKDIDIHLTEGVRDGLINSENYKQFENFYAFDSLNEIPENWKFLEKESVKFGEKLKNLFYEIDNDIVGIIVKSNHIKLDYRFYTIILDKKVFFDLFNKYDKISFSIYYDSRRPDYMIYPIISIGESIDKYSKRLHRFLLGLNHEEILVDHINRCTLDNRLSNLRKVNVVENNRNLSPRKNTKFGVLGVYYDEKKHWFAKRTVKIGVSDSGSTKLKTRHVSTSSFNDAVIARKKLELIEDSDFLSSELTLVLFDKYEKEGKFDDLYLKMKLK